jgi:uncharacterized protein (TIGR02271 family)
MTRSDIREGMAVYSADGTKLGKVTDAQEGSFFIEKGFFFPKEYVARYDEIADIRGDEVFLRGSDEMLKGGGEYASTTGRTGAASEGEYLSGYQGESRGGLEDTSRQANLGASDQGSLTGTTKHVDIPVVEEELTAEKRVRDAGEVRVRKEVTTEQRQVTVPVTREEVHVERLPADASANVGEGAFEEGTMSIPVREEEVEIRKRPVVREQVRVSRTAHQEERRADAEVRREEVRVERDDDLRREPSTRGIDDPDDR